jgi:hypothetical protein
MGFADGTAQARVDARYGTTGLTGEALKARHTALGREIVAAQRIARQEPVAPSASAEQPLASVRHLPATERQIGFLMSLRASRTPHVDPEQALDWARNAGRAAVSARIDALKVMPVVSTGTGAPTSNVPVGRYAVTGKDGQTVFLKVDRPTEGLFRGRVFVRVQAGDELHRVSADVRNALLAKVETDGPEAASRRYGREIGSCGRCGKTLTDDASRAEGIGPICAAKAW